LALIRPLGYPALTLHFVTVIQDAFLLRCISVLRLLIWYAKIKNELKKKKKKTPTKVKTLSERA